MDIVKMGKISPMPTPMISQRVKPLTKEKKRLEVYEERPKRGNIKNQSYLKIIQLFSFNAVLQLWTDFIKLCLHGR